MYENTAADVTTPVTCKSTDLIWHMQFTNPVAGAVPAYDGFYATSGAAVTWDGTGTAAPTLIKFSERSNIIDLIPESDYDQTLDTAAVATDSVSLGCEAAAWAEVASAGDSGQCTESWTLGTSGIACVQVKGQFTRNLATPSSDTNKCDIELDYIAYVVKI